MKQMEKKYLKLLGYEDTQEEGALLRHKYMNWEDTFVWENESFENILTSYRSRIERAVRTKIAQEIQEE